VSDEHHHTRDKVLLGKTESFQQSNRIKCFTQCGGADGSGGGGVGSLFLYKIIQIPDAQTEEHGSSNTKVMASIPWKSVKRLNVCFWIKASDKSPI